MTLLSLRAGRLSVDLAPQAGGSVAHFPIDGQDRSPAADDGGRDGFRQRQRCGRLSAGPVFQPHRERSSPLRRKGNTAAAQLARRSLSDAWRRLGAGVERAAKRRPVGRDRLHPRRCARGRRLAVPLPRPPVLSARRRAVHGAPVAGEPRAARRARRAWSASLLRARFGDRARLPHAGRLAERRRGPADGTHRRAAAMGLRQAAPRRRASCSTTASTAGMAGRRSSGRAEGWDSSSRRASRSAIS